MAAWVVRKCIACHQLLCLYTWVCIIKFATQDRLVAKANIGHVQIPAVDAEDADEIAWPTDHRVPTRRTCNNIVSRTTYPTCPA